MKTVDVLRDDGLYSPRSLPFGQNLMTAVWLAVIEVAVRNGLLPPILITGVRTRQKVLEVDWLRIRPNPARRTKIRNTTLSADPRACKCDGVLRTTQTIRNFLTYRHRPPLGGYRP